MKLSESNVEAASLDRLDGYGWNVANGPDIAPTYRARNAPTTVRLCWKGGCAMSWSG